MIIARTAQDGGDTSFFSGGIENAWLEHHDTFDRTGIDADRVRFCRRRADKATICAELGLTHFIDDRIDVLAPMRGVVEHLHLFGTEPGPADERWLTVLPDWPTAVERVQPSGPAR